MAQETTTRVIEIIQSNKSAQNIPYDTARQLFVRTRGRIILDYNPTHVFWSHDYIQPREDCVHITSTYKDNEFLSPEQVREIEANRNDARWWRVYGEGEVGIAEGVIYDFEQVDAMPEKADGMVEAYGLDFGFTNDPSVLVHCYVHQGRKEIYLDQMFYRKGLLNKDISDMMQGMGVTRNVPIYADSAEPKSIAELGQYGWNVFPCYKATRITEQIEHIHQYKMFVTKRSVEGVRELRNYMWAKDKDGRPINEPQGGFDHFCDAFRYGVFTPLSRFAGVGSFSFV